AHDRRRGPDTHRHHHHRRSRRRYLPHRRDRHPPHPETGQAPHHGHRPTKTATAVPDRGRRSPGNRPTYRRAGGPRTRPHRLTPPHPRDRLLATPRRPADITAPAPPATIRARRVGDATRMPHEG